MEDINNINYFFNSEENSLNKMTCIIYNSNIVIALADDNNSQFNCLTYSSTDGFNTTTNIPMNNWSSITYDDLKHKFIAIGKDTDNCIATTTDGITWLNYMAINGLWKDIICYYNNNNSAYYAIGGNQLIKCYMTDPLNIWTTIEIPSGSWTSIATNCNTSVNNNTNPILVAVSDQAPNYIIYSSLNSIWSLSNNQIIGAWKKVIYGNNRFVAVSNQGPNYIIYSDDGKNWSLANNQYEGNWSNIAFGNNMFIIVEKASSTVKNNPICSFDGITWFQLNIYLSNAISFNNTTNKFISFGNYNTNELVVISDNSNILNLFGEYIKRETIPINNKNLVGDTHRINIPHTRALVYGNSVFLSVKNNLNIKHSIISVINQNNATSTILTLIENNNINSGTYGNGCFVLLSDKYVLNHNIYITYDGGTSFIKSSINVRHNWIKIVYGKGMFVALSTNYIAYSTDDAITWVVSPLPTGDWSNICYGANNFVLLSTNINNGIIYSSNCITWSNGIIPQNFTKNIFTSIVFGTKFVAISNSSTVGTTNILYSNNGINWYASECPSNDWGSITYGAVKSIYLDENRSYYIACCKNKLILAYSSDGIQWYSLVSTLLEQYKKYNYNNIIYNNIIQYGNYSFIISCPMSNVTLSGTTIDLIYAVNKYFNDFKDHVSTITIGNTSEKCNYEINSQTLKGIIELVKKPYSINYIINTANNENTVLQRLGNILSTPNYQLKTNIPDICGDCDKNVIPACGEMTITKVAKKIRKFNFKTGWKTLTSFTNVGNYTRCFNTSNNLTVNINPFKYGSLSQITSGISIGNSIFSGNITGALFYEAPGNFKLSDLNPPVVLELICEVLGINKLNLGSITPNKGIQIITSLINFITTRSPKIFSICPTFDEIKYNSNSSKFEDGSTLNTIYQSFILDTIAISKLTFKGTITLTIIINTPSFCFNLPNMIIKIPEFNLVTNTLTNNKTFPILIRNYGKYARKGIKLVSFKIIGIIGLIKFITEMYYDPYLYLATNIKILPNKMNVMKRQAGVDLIRDLYMFLDQIDGLPEVKKILQSVSFILKTGVSLKFCLYNKSNPLYLQLKCVIVFKPYAFITDILELSNLSGVLANKLHQWTQTYIKFTPEVETAFEDYINELRVNNNDKAKEYANKIIQNLSKLNDATITKIDKINLPLPSGSLIFNMSSFSSNLEATIIASNTTDGTTSNTTSNTTDGTTSNTTDGTTSNTTDGTTSNTTSNTTDDTTFFDITINKISDSINNSRPISAIFSNIDSNNNNITINNEIDDPTDLTPLENTSLLSNIPSYTDPEEEEEDEEFDTNSTITTNDNDKINPRPSYFKLDSNFRTTYVERNDQGLSGGPTVKSNV